MPHAQGLRQDIRRQVNHQGINYDPQPDFGALNIFAGDPTRPFLT